MCNCGKTAESYVPKYKQILVKDRFGKIIMQKVPIINQKLKKQLKKLRREYLESKKPKTLEEEINNALK